jgi:hypothetical protein
MAASNSAEQTVEPRMSQLSRAVFGELHESASFTDTERMEKVKAGTHRFDVHPGQSIFQQPQGFLVDREKDRLQRLARNVEAIKLWENRYVEVTDDGFVIRENKMPKLKLVQSNGSQ